MADGLDWNRILEVVAPVAGSLAAHGAGGSAGFQQGFLHGRELARQEREQRDQVAQNRSKYAGDYALHVLDQLNGLDNPEEFAALRDLAAAHAPDDDTRAQIKAQTLPADRLAPATRQELHDAVQTYLDLFDGDASQAAQAGGSIHLSRANRSFAIPDALALTLPAVQDASGQQKFLTTPKVEKVGGTEEERFTQKWAKDRGKKAADLTADEELQARKAFRDAGRADPKAAPAASADAQFADLVDLWKETHRGQEPPANVRTQLRVQAKKEIGQADDRPASALVGGTDIEGIADAIIAGDQPPTLQGLYRLGAPVRAALARKGFHLANAQSDWQATQRHLATLNGPQQTRMRQAVDNASHSLDVIENLATQWDAGRFPVLNKARLALAKGGAYGDQAASIARQLEGQIADVTSELGNVYMGGNSPTDHALGLAAKNLSADWSKATLLDMLRLARTNLQIRTNSMKNTSAVGATPQNPYLPTPPPTPPSVQAPSGGDAIYARDENGVLHKATNGTPLPRGWTVERR